jgi:putative transposase
MIYNPEKHHRRSIRLPSYDYTQEGAYFITICTHGRECFLGNIVDGKMNLSQSGKIVWNGWRWLDQQYSYVDLDKFIVMPNHLHGILFISEECWGDSLIAPTRRKPLGRLIGVFKTISTKQINCLRNTMGVRIWQRNYYERIIRNEQELNFIREYILSNPHNWDTDEENPINLEQKL